MPGPSDPIAAVTHRDPYPYYARLVAERPLDHDAGLGLWVAASAEAVGTVLANGLCRVRPPAEPVPAALVGTPAGEVFRLLVRMNDGAAHAPAKRAVAAALASVGVREAAGASREWAGALAQELRPQLGPDRLQELVFRLPVYVVASLLGVDRDRLEEAARWTGELAACFAPAANREQAARGSAAAAELCDLLRPRVGAPPRARGGGLLGELACQVERTGACPAEGAEPRQVERAGASKVERAGAGQAAEALSVALANAVGFLFQAYDATAGLIGNTLVSLARHREAREQVRAEPGRLRDVIAEVLRHDPPVQNTRRFVAAAGTIAGREMRAGDAVLVVLAAANRDPAVHSHPERFDLSRRAGPLLSFGAGAHACPGQDLAAVIAQAGVEQLLRAGVDLAPLARPAAYRASANVRIPLFNGGGGR